MKALFPLVSAPQPLGRVPALQPDARGPQREEDAAADCVGRVDLAGAVLQLLCLGEADVLRFPRLEPPPEATVARALELLQRLGAVSERGVTDLGRVLARLPVHPRARAAAPTRSELPASAGHGGPGQLLGEYLSGGA
jgi:hypothetical protein